jgi:hypothetical protein
MTWLDWYVRDRADSVRALFRANCWAMPLTSDGTANAIAAFGVAISMNMLEYSADPETHAATEGGPKRAYENFLLSGCMLPFLNGFIPVNRRAEGLVTGAGLGLILRRETADMLADAAPPAADLWRRRVFGVQPEGSGLGGVYIDIPHGALRLGGDLQLRALFATPGRTVEDYANANRGALQTGTVLVAAVITAQGSDRPKGLVFAVVDEEDRVRIVSLPDTSPTGFLNADEEHLGEIKSRDAAGLFNLFYERTVGFLRLVLAYYHYGPAEARSEIRVTSPARFARNQGRPRTGESIFAMVRLAAPTDRLGRPRPINSSTGWVLTAQQEVAGHFKLQPHGPAQTLRRLIWVESYQRGPSDAPSKPHGVRV